MESRYTSKSDFLDKHPACSLEQFNETTFKINNMGKGMRLVRKKGIDEKEYWVIYKIQW